MRPALATVLVVAILAVGAAPTSMAHESGIHHGAVESGTLASGASVTKPLEFEGGKLIGGWVFLLVASVQGGPLEAGLSLAGAVVKSWTIPPSVPWHATTVLPRDGVYDLTLRNQGLAAVTYAAYFDQSCNCQGKALPDPGVIPDGIVVFNVDAPGPGEVRLEMYGPRAVRARVTAALLVGAEGQWPRDFAVLGSTSRPELRQASPGIEPAVVYDLRATVEGAGRVYFFVESLEIVAADYEPIDLAVQPRYTFSPASSFPWVWIAAVAGGLAGAVLLWRLRARSGPVGGREVSRAGGARGGRRTRTSRARRRRR